MRKFVALVCAFVLSAAGLIAMSTGSAQAKPCPYNGCFDTNTNVTAPKQVKQGRAPKVRVTVSVKGNLKPQGELKVVVTNESGFREVITVDYTRPRSVRLPALNERGTYTVRVAFKAPNRFRGSQETMTIRVKR
jgi:hypothetical protein